MTKITKTNEDYLEAILMHEKNGSAKSVDIANALNVSKAAVSIAMNELISKGFIDKEVYGNIKLTSKGRKIASDTLRKHHIIKKALLSIGVCDETAEEECCKIEHILSDETLKCLQEALSKLN